jgi:hypothetical protein
MIRLSPVLSPRAQAALHLVRASRHGTDLERRKFLFRFVRDLGVPPVGDVNWREAVQKIPFSIVAAVARRAKWATGPFADERHFFIACEALADRTA